MCSSRRSTPSSMAPCSRAERTARIAAVPELLLHGELALRQPAGLGQRLIDGGHDLLLPLLLHALALLLKLIAQRLERLLRPARPAAAPAGAGPAGLPRRPVSSAPPACLACVARRVDAAAAVRSRPSPWRAGRSAEASESARAASSRSAWAARTLSAVATWRFHSRCSCASSLDSLLRLARSPSSAARRNSSRLRSSASRASFCASASRSSASWVRSASRSLSACCSSCSRSRSSGESARSSCLADVGQLALPRRIAETGGLRALPERLERVLQRLRLLHQLLLRLGDRLRLLRVLERQRLAVLVAAALGRPRAAPGPGRRSAARAACSRPRSSRDGSTRLRSPAAGRPAPRSWSAGGARTLASGRSGARARCRSRRPSSARCRREEAAPGEVERVG